jgi:outer membrane lipoprotein-sorting protein
VSRDPVNEMFTRLLISLIAPLLVFPILSGPPARGSEGSRVLAVVQKMESAFAALEDYACEVEQIFYREGAEDQRLRSKLYFKKNKKLRVDFSHPYSSLSIFYHDKEKEATVLPFRSLPSLRFRLSIDNPMIKTLAGQRVDQTDVGYFIEFLSKNLKEVEQGENEFYEDTEQVRFILRALDYIGGESLEKYRIFISKKFWLPTRIERYSAEDKLIEMSVISNYAVNAHLQDKFFAPWGGLK